MRCINDFINGYAKGSTKTYATRENAERAFAKSGLELADGQSLPGQLPSVAYMKDEDDRWVVVVINYPFPVAPAERGFVSWA